MSLSVSSLKFLHALLSWTSLFACFLFISSVQGQSSSELKANQKRLKAEIALTQSNLKQLAQDKSVGFNRYDALLQQIKSREALITNVENEIDLISADIIAQEADLKLLKEQFDKQKTYYKKAVREYYNFRVSYHPMAFILSSSNLVTAWKRMSFYQKQSRYHKSQMTQLQAKQDELLIELEKLKQLQLEKETALQTIKSQQAQLTRDEASKKAELDRLAANQGFLEKRLKAQEAQASKLTALLAKLVEEGISKRATKALPAESRKLSSAFGSNKGRLPWPVTKGYVAKRFGKQRHPDLKMIFITNNGIDIVTEEGAEVSAVFGGKVMAVQNVAGFNNTILLNHGNYYTVYANVENVLVSTGETVESGQTLAYASANNKIASVHFELWKGKQLQNPSSWLKKR